MTAPDAPEWFETTVLNVIAAGYALNVAEPDDVADARDDIIRTLQAFGEAVEANGGDDTQFLGLVLSLAHAAKMFAPDGAFGEGDGMTRAVIEDRNTGEIVDDPDAEVTDAAGTAALAAMRIVAAVIDDDTGLAADIFHATGQHPDPAVPGMLMVVLAEYAGAYLVDHQRRKGGLPDDVEARLAARDAAALAEEDQREAARRPRPGADGIEFVSVTPDDRDKGPAAAKVAAPHGPAVYCIGAYVPGVDGHRDAVIEGAHRQIPLMDADSTDREPLCGVQHAEDVETWQMPHTGRASANRHLRHLKRMTGRPGQLLRCWQHIGACPGGDA